MKHKKLNKKSETQNHEYLCYVNERGLTQVSCKAFRCSCNLHEFILSNFCEGVDTIDIIKGVHECDKIDSFVVFRSNTIYIVDFSIIEGEQSLTIDSRDANLDFARLYAMLRNKILLII